MFSVVVLFCSFSAVGRLIQHPCLSIDFCFLSFRAFLFSVCLFSPLSFYVLAWSASTFELASFFTSFIRFLFQLIPLFTILYGLGLQGFFWRGSRARADDQTGCGCGCQLFGAQNQTPLVSAAPRNLTLDARRNGAAAP